MTRADRLLITLELHVLNAVDALEAYKMQRQADLAHAELVRRDNANALQDTERGGTPAPDIVQER